MKRKKKNPLMREHQRPAHKAQKGLFMQGQYSTKKAKKERVGMIIAIALLAGMIALNLFAQPEVVPDVEYRMTNQKIEWTWAGR